LPARRTPSDEETDALFTLDPSEFISARDELAGRLKEKGRTEEAAEVRGLRRPTVAAWAVNRAVREHPADIKELFAAGAELRAVQRKMLSGVKSGGFREAVDRRRKAVAKLNRAAEQVLRESGHSSPGATEAISATFEAASLDEGAAELVRAGRLSKEFAAPSGFGGVEGLELVPSLREAKPAKRGRAKEVEDEAASKAAQREAKKLAEAAVQARRGAIRARREADRAEEKVERLTAELEESRAAMREASAKARKAEADATRAQAEADHSAKR